MLRVAADSIAARAAPHSATFSVVVTVSPSSPRRSPSSSPRAAGAPDDRPSLGAKESNDPATTTTTVPAYTSFTAQPLGSEVAVHQQPDESSPSEAYPNPWQLDDNPEHTVPQVFLVTEQNDDWAQVLLPVRPNGTTGWVKKSDVRLTPNRFRIEVALGAAPDHRVRR